MLKACSSDQWQCDHGTCIKRSQRCDGRIDCPLDRSDERNCFGEHFYDNKYTTIYACAGYLILFVSSTLSTVSTLSK